MQKYRLLMLEKTQPPTDAKTKRWYRYVITNGITEINGYRSGTEKEVREFSKNCIKHLNKDLKQNNRPHTFRPAYMHYAYEMSL